MPGRYVRSAILIGSIPLLKEWGEDAIALADELGIDRAALSDPDIPVPARYVFDFYERAAQRSGCASFGLRMAERTGMIVIGPLWVLVRQARTVREMLDELTANFELYTQAATAGLTREGDAYRLSWSIVAGVADSEVQMAEYSLAVMCSEIRRHAPPRWEPADVRLRHAAPPDRGDLRRVFGPRLRFNQPDNSLLLDRALLERPVLGGGSRTRALLGHMLRQELGGSDPGLVERVEAMVRTMLPYSPCTLADLSRTMGIAPRTLQEHLQFHRRSFQDIRDAVRSDLAAKYLKHSSLSIAHIAEILGYSEPSAFSRSFRRWHGISARSIRATLREEAAQVPSHPAQASPNKP